MIGPEYDTLNLDVSDVQHDDDKFYSGEFPQLKLKYTSKVMSNSIKNSRDTAMFLRRVWDNDLISIQEQVYILFLNNNNQVISYRCLHTGSTNQTLFDIKLAMACALGCLAEKVIISHNHPSGFLRPSPGDLAVTKQLKSACELLDIQLIDHIIMNQWSYFSFKDDRLIV